MPRIRVLLTLCALLAVGAAGAQTCPERDVEVEQQGLGIVRADSLDTGNGTLLERACFTLRDLTFDAARLSVPENGGDVRAEDVSISGAGLSGHAATLLSGGGPVNFGNLTLNVILPSTSLPGLPLPQGAYELRATSGDLAENRFRFADALLVRAGSGETYRLVNAELAGQTLTARQADLGPLTVESLAARPNLVQGGPARLGLCRDPRSRELELRASGLTATPGGTVLSGADLRLLGLRLPTPAKLILPLRASGATLSDTGTSLLNDAARLRALLATAAPQPVLSADAFGVRDIPLFDPHNSRLNVVLHRDYLEFGIRSEVAGFDASLGIFEQPDTGAPLPLLTAYRVPLTGAQEILALRGAGELSEARFGVARALGSARLLAEVGAGAQGGAASVFAHLGFGIERGANLGGLALYGRAAGDLYGFPSAGQASLELLGRASLALGRANLVAEQFERQVVGGAPLPALQLLPARLTTLGVTYDPDLTLGPLGLRGLGYFYTYDWLARAPTQSVLSAGATLRAGAAQVAPAVSYDLALGRLGASADVTLNSACFTYGAVLSAYREPARSGFTLRLKFGLR